MDKQEAIKRVLDEFDFTKVERVMWLLQHTWMGKDGEYFPSIQEMRKTAERILSNAYDHALDHEETWSWSNGGFHAYAFYDGDDNSIDIELAFVVDDKSETVDRLY